MATALKAQQDIVIVGDFDADGATSTALAVSALRVFGAQNVSYLVPNRFAYGYGLSTEIVDVAKQAAPDLIITVDNGIVDNVFSLMLKCCTSSMVKRKNANSWHMLSW